MLSLFKSDPAKKLKKARAQKLEQAMHAQRNGDIRSYSSLTDEAEKLLQDIQQLQNSSTKKS